MQKKTLRKNMAVQSAGGKKRTKEGPFIYVSCPQDFVQPFYGHIQWTKQEGICVV